MNSLCRWILASWCCVACATASAGTTVWVNIPQESIVKALKDFSRQSGVKVVAELTAEEAGLSMNGLRGRVTVDEGLTSILTDTSLTFEYLDKGVVVVHGRLIRFDIPSETLVEAVTQWRSQAGVDLLYTYQTVVQYQPKTERVLCDCTAMEALCKVLRHTKFTLGVVRAEPPQSFVVTERDDTSASDDDCLEPQSWGPTYIQIPKAQWR